MNTDNENEKLKQAFDIAANNLQKAVVNLFELTLPPAKDDSGKKAMTPATLLTGVSLVTKLVLNMLESLHSMALGAIRDGIVSKTPSDDVTADTPEWWKKL